MSMVSISVGDYRFVARFEEADAPATCAAFKAVMPFESQLIQARWSGESGWVPLGDYQLGVGFENATSYPAPGEILFYPGGYSETEILFPYGPTCFASKLGQLAGNHFLTIVEGLDQLKALRRVLPYDGAQPIRFAALAHSASRQTTQS